MKLKSSKSGFTYIEALVAVLVVAAASVSLGYGVVYARGQLKAIAIQHRALDELTSYMELWNGRFLDSHITARELGGDQRGEEVIIFAPFVEEGDNQSVEDVIKGKIFRKKTRKEYSVFNDKYMGYYHLEAWIVWDDPFTVDGEPHEIRLATKTINLQ